MYALYNVMTCFIWGNLLESCRINLSFYKFIRISINELLIILNLRSKNKTTKIVIFLDYPIKDFIDFIFEKSFDL